MHIYNDISNNLEIIQKEQHASKLTQMRNTLRKLKFYHSHWGQTWNIFYCQCNITQRKVIHKWLNYNKLNKHVKMYTSHYNGTFLKRIS